MESEPVVRALGALAQEHRLALFRLLVQAGPDGLPAGAIAGALGLALDPAFGLGTPVRLRVQVEAIRQEEGP